MPIFAEAPDYEQPLFRFLRGTASLKEAKSSAAFTIWEAVLHFRDDEYPLVMRGEEFSRDDLLRHVAEILDEGEIRTGRCAVGDEGLKSIRKECVSKGLLEE